MVTISPALRLTLGQQFGPLTQDYARRVEAVGGRFDAAGRALQALDRMLYGYYSNNEGGLGRVADLLPAFLSFWAPVSTFAGITQTIVGPAVINTGYVSGDWDLGGMQGGASKFLDSGIALNRLTDSVYGMGFFSNTNLVLTSVQLMGARQGNSSFCFDLGATTGGRFRIRPGTGSTTIEESGSAGSDMLLMSRLAATGTNNVRFFRNNNVVSISSNSTTTSGAETIYYGALNAGGSVSTPLQNRYNAAFITQGIAFNTPDIWVLRNALNALNGARASL